MVSSDRSFSSVGFCSPSSMTMAWAPPSIAARAPAARSPEIQAGRSAASSRASSPTSWLSCFAGSTRSGPFSLPP